MPIHITSWGKFNSPHESLRNYAELLIEKYVNRTKLDWVIDWDKVEEDEKQKLIALYIESTWTNPQDGIAEAIGNCKKSDEVMEGIFQHLKRDSRESAIELGSITQTALMEYFDSAIRDYMDGQILFSEEKYRRDMGYNKHVDDHSGEEYHSRY